MTTLQIGDKAPEFIAIDQHGKTQKLTDYLGKKVVLFFYPKANTPGCTAEACDLSANYATFQKQNYQIIGVSSDPVKSQLKFSEKFNFSFPLLADENKEVIEAYKVWGPKKFMGKEFDGIHRTTFIIDENGFISNIIKEVKTKAHAVQILGD